MLTKDEAIQLLKNNATGKQERIADLLKNGYRAYTTAPGKATKHKYFFNSIISEIFFPLHMYLCRMAWLQQRKND